MTILVILCRDSSTGWFDCTLGHPGEGPGQALNKRIKASRGTKQQSRVRDTGKGAQAWQNLAAASEQMDLAGRMLLAHTVSDKTGLKMYLPAVAKFIDFAQEHTLPCQTWEDIDEAMLKYLGNKCYMEHQHAQQGALAVNGLCYLLPGATRELPNSWRALKGWQGVTITEEGQPVALERLACMGEALRRHGGDKETQAADMIDLAADAYLREQDLIQLRVEDVIIDEETSVSTLLLGRSKRGETCKGGRDQGVVMDNPWSTLILSGRCRDKKPDQQVFTINSTTYRKLWQWSAEEVTGDPTAAGTPHSARHTGASRDLTEGYRNLEEVMKRGRWKALNSVHRYAKPHALYAAQAKLSQQERDNGRRILAKRPLRTGSSPGGLGNLVNDTSATENEVSIF